MAKTHTCGTGAKAQPGSTTAPCEFERDLISSDVYIDQRLYQRGLRQKYLSRRSIYDCVPPLRIRRSLQKLSFVPGTCTCSNQPIKANKTETWLESRHKIQNPKSSIKYTTKLDTNTNILLPILLTKIPQPDATRSDATHLLFNRNESPIKFLSIQNPKSKIQNPSEHFILSFLFS